MSRPDAQLRGFLGSSRRPAGRPRDRPDCVRQFCRRQAGTEAVSQPISRLHREGAVGGADGDKTPTVEKLHMYVAEARFVIARPPRAIDLAQYVSIGYLEGIDVAIKHRLIQARRS